MSVTYCGSFRKIGSRYKLACMDWERVFCKNYDRRASERGTVHSDKLSASLSRTKRNIVELGLCNDWDYFVTLTIDPEKYDRYNLPKFKQDLAKWINNYNSRKMPEGQRVDYLLVPERHQDGAWHLHGLLKGLPAEHLSDFEPEKHPLKLVLSGFKNWAAYEKKFGYFSAGEIRDKDACVFYMLKYITKDLAKNALDLNSRMYFASQGLKKGEYLFKNNLVELDDGFPFDFEHEYCRVKNLTFAQDLESWGNVVVFDSSNVCVDDGMSEAGWDDFFSDYVHIEDFIRDEYGQQLRL